MSGGEASSASAALGARAYAHGNNVAFESSPDLHTAAHEAAHVVQQRSGVHLKAGIDGGASDPYEQHADAVADAVAAGRSAEHLLDQHANAERGAADTSVQRAPATHQQAPGAMITVTLFDAHQVFITSRTEPLYSSASNGIYSGRIDGDAIKWSSGSFDVQLGNKVGADGKLLGAMSIASWARDAGKGRAKFVLVDVDAAEQRSDDVKPGATEPVNEFETPARISLVS